VQLPALDLRPHPDDGAPRIERVREQLEHGCTPLGHVEQALQASARNLTSPGKPAAPPTKSWGPSSAAASTNAGAGDREGALARRERKTRAGA
jgi:hypothetical protein